MIDRIAHTAPPATTFDPPAPGQWELETAHHGLRPLSPFLRDSYRRACEAGIVEPLQRYGLPLAAVQAEFVNGCLYMRPLAVGEKPGSAPKAPPPALVMKLIVRLHPELRRRARTAKQAFAERTWRREVDQWFDHDRSAQLAANVALQAVDPDALDDAGLAAHIEGARSHFERSARRNLATHGGDLVPTGDLLAHCEQWGISANEAAGLLTGSSPATVETAGMLRPVAHAVQRVGGSTASLGSVDDAAVRARVPAEHRAHFDELVAEARYGHRQRDDIRGLCWNWPCGLVRRGLLEAGRRAGRAAHRAVGELAAAGDRRPRGGGGRSPVPRCDRGARVRTRSGDRSPRSNHAHPTWRPGRGRSDTGHRPPPLMGVVARLPSDRDGRSDRRGPMRAPTRGARVC